MSIVTEVVWSLLLMEGDIDLISRAVGVDRLSQAFHAPAVDELKTASMQYVTIVGKNNISNVGIFPKRINCARRK
jgi:hypothetical protein